ncbi:MAG: maleylpyruvate isomerase N-terminal domain-containing protein [Acidobacteria bacterium]|nr:maleylpyruvate isomerase N-terminal domain-containing protein [Acidobacteriota bacterium]
MISPAPILCADLLRKVDSGLVDLLRSLEPRDWDLPTIAGSWTVRDVAAHLLDTALRKLALVRDGCQVDAVEIRSPDDLVTLVNRLNREGVTVHRRLSPPLLIDLLELACRQSADFHESLDPFGPAAFAVSWAGETRSANWFDTARELTERWHHQQQIRLATARPGMMDPEVHHPVLDCFVRGLPHLFQVVEAGAGTVVAVEITGESGGEWAVHLGEVGWRLGICGGESAAARVTIPESIAWRLFTKGIERAAALGQVRIEGDRRLGERVLSLTAIVA